MTYTPMLLPAVVPSKKYLNVHLKTHPDDRPLVAQLGGSNLNSLVNAAKILESRGVDAVDVRGKEIFSILSLIIIISVKFRMPTICCQERTLWCFFM